jgi:hypothetical protein
MKFLSCLFRNWRKPKLVRCLGFRFVDVVSGECVYKWRAADGTVWLAAAPGLLDFRIQVEENILTNPHDREAVRAECDQAVENGYENILDWTPEQLANDLLFYSAVAEDMKLEALVIICKEWLDDKRKDRDDPVGVGNQISNPPDGAGLHAERVPSSDELASAGGQQQPTERLHRPRGRS